MENYRLRFVSSGCNLTPNALSWGAYSGWVAYAGCNSIYVYDSQSIAGIKGILNGHTDRVNCVSWLQNSKDIISGSSDKSLIVWKYEDTNQWILHEQLSGHADAVCAVTNCCYSDGSCVVASASSDNTLRVWIRRAKEFVLTQTLTYGNGFVLSLSLAALPSSNGMLLACGCDDTTIKLYSDNATRQFVAATSLRGHEDWVRCLAFARKPDSLLLASGSQDSYIRLWSISSAQQEENDDIVLTKQLIHDSKQEYSVSLESVLIGHENWVYGLSWYQPPEGVPMLVSSSMDKSLIVWSYDSENHIWLDQARVGDVGGNTLGFYGCAFSPSGDQIIAHGYQGALQMWKKTQEENQWTACVTVGGHFKSVEDFTWEKEGEFAITASSDQTTRIFAPWKREDICSWHEIARTQIHGYDMKCVTLIDRFTFVSGAHEKILRAFCAPKTFRESFYKITQVKKETSQSVCSTPLGATVPVLGLSNKPVYSEDLESWENTTQGPTKASTFANDDPAPFNPSLINVHEPPVEDVLLQNTLWPEVHKLYGHGFELFCVASSPAGDVIASACKATKAEHACVFIWEVSTWKNTQSLAAHSLTVTQMAFSADSLCLLSVSRDRTWALHMRAILSAPFELAQKTDKTTCMHTRLIWACSWFDGRSSFVTASRDKHMIVWGCHGNEWQAEGAPVDLQSSVTAVSVCKEQMKDQSWLIAGGLETGAIKIFSWKNKEWNMLYTLTNNVCPTLSIKRLLWRPKSRDLGVASSDHSFRIIEFIGDEFT